MMKMMGSSTLIVWMKITMMMMKTMMIIMMMIKRLHNLFQVYLKLQDEHNIPAADFPDVDVMREKLKK